MTNIDQFESVFKAADKKTYEFETIDFERVLVVSDLADDACHEFTSRAETFLAVLEHGDWSAAWRSLGASDFSTVGDMLWCINENDPDLIVSYRNLHFPATEYPYSLGAHLDVLTQVTKTPVLVTPHPDWLRQHPESMQNTQTVMAITDHLTQENHLVSAAAVLTQPEGQLWLTHVEDQGIFERYMQAIARIPSIDTDNAERVLLTQLLKEPADYIESCRTALESLDMNITIASEAVLGRRLNDYKRLIENHKVSLLVMNTKDEQQMAMHGMAYPLTVEMRETPLLLV